MRGWRMPSGSCATFGKTICLLLRSLLIRKNKTEFHLFQSCPLFVVANFLRNFPIRKFVLSTKEDRFLSVLGTRSCKWLDTAVYLPIFRPISVLKGFSCCVKLLRKFAIACFCLRTPYSHAMDSSRFVSHFSSLLDHSRIIWILKIVVVISFD